MSLHALREPGRRRVAAWLAAIALALLPAALAPSPAAAAPLAAQPAGAFRDSIGVQTHLSFPSFAYDRATTADLSAKLRALGVYHLRDSACLLTEGECARVRRRLAELRDALGPGAPRVDLVAGYTRQLVSATDRATRDADIERALEAVASPPLAGMVAALEAVNEPDLKGARDWEAAVLADEAELEKLLKEPRFASLRDLPQLSPPIGHDENTPSLLAAGWDRSHADIGNFHPYPPAWGGPESALNRPCGDTDTLGCALRLGAAAKPYATESGYTTSGSWISTSWVSERAQGIYLPRLLLENFRSGVARTYIYELVDLRPSLGSAVEGYGLWRSRYVDGIAALVPAGPKPAALAISRMNETIGDLGELAGPAASLDVTVSAAGRALGDSDVRRVLLRRSDGTYVLALWRPEVVWENDVGAQRDVTVDDLAATVRIGGSRWDAQATRPSRGEGATGNWSGATEIELPIGPDVTLLALEPAAEDPGTSGPPPSGAGGSGGAQAAAMKAAWDLLAALVAALW